MRKGREREKGGEGTRCLLWGESDERMKGRRKGGKGIQNLPVLYHNLRFVS